MAWELLGQVPLAELGGRSSWPRRPSWEEPQRKERGGGAEEQGVAGRSRAGWGGGGRGWGGAGAAGRGGGGAGRGGGGAAGRSWGGAGAAGRSWGKAEGDGSEALGAQARWAQPAPWWRPGSALLSP